MSMVHNSYVLKYGSDNLIIFYCYTYSEWSGIIKVVIWTLWN